MSWQSRADRLDREGPVTLWRQVADDITRMIDTGELPSNQRLPSEADLTEVYGVARVTVRRAIRELVDAGRLTVVQGRGTFVT